MQNQRVREREYMKRKREIDRNTGRGKRGTSLKEKRIEEANQGDVERKTER